MGWATGQFAGSRRGAWILGWDIKNFPACGQKIYKTLQTACKTQKKGYSIGVAQNGIDKKSKAKPETARSKDYL